MYTETRRHRDAQQTPPGATSSHLQCLSASWFRMGTARGGEQDAPGFHGASNILSPLKALDKQRLEELGVAIIFPAANLSKHIKKQKLLLISNPSLSSDGDLTRSYLQSTGETRQNKEVI